MPKCWQMPHVMAALPREPMLERHQGDFRKIVEGVNNTLDLIVTPIAAVKESVDTILTAANEISSGNNDLSSRTEQQASSLEETAASMEELAGTVKTKFRKCKTG